MAEITVEDGTGVAGANSYVTLVEFKSYFDNRNDNAYTSYDDCEIEAGMINAFQYLESEYGTCFIGSKLTKSQGGHFPVSDGVRSDGFELDEDEIPQEVKDAQCELAKVAMDGTNLYPSDSVDVQTGIKKIKEKVGPIEEEIEYRDDGAVILDSFYRKADSLLWPIVKQDSLNGEVIRN